MFKNTRTESSRRHAAQQAAVSRPPSEWIPVVVSALSRQCDLCRTLESLSVRQSEQIRSGDSDGLLRVLAERQGIVDQVAELNDELSPYRAQWETCLAAAGRDERSRLELLVTQLTDLVERIARQDDADRAALESRRSALSTELGGVIRGRGAVAAYNGLGATNRPRFQDQNG